MRLPEHIPLHPDRFPALLIPRHDVDHHVGAVPSQLCSDDFLWLDDKTLLDDEIYARENELGLWSLPEAQRVPPWDWRRGKRETALKPESVPDQTFSCGTKRKCGEMGSCAEARFYLEECGLNRLDGDGDGVPCESLCR